MDKRHSRLRFIARCVVAAMVLVLGTVQVAADADLALAQPAVAVVAPSEAWVMSGTSISLTARALDAAGHTAQVGLPIWSVTGSGSITSAGIYTAGSAGVAHVQAIFVDAGVTGRATVHVAEAVDLVDLEIGPASATWGKDSINHAALLVGQKWDGHAWATTAEGIPVRATLDWTSSANIEPDGSAGFVPKTAGEGWIQAVLPNHPQGLVKRIPATIIDSGQIAHIHVDLPRPSTFVGQELRFSATAFDAQGTRYDLPEPEWRATGGTIDWDGTYVAQDEGGYKVSATISGTLHEGAAVGHTGHYGDVLGVQANALSNCMLVNDRQQLTATGFDEWGRPSPLDAVWSAIGGVVVSPDGEVWATAAGEATATACVPGDGIVGQATIHVGDWDDITGLEVSPNMSGAIIKDKVWFSCSGVDDVGLRYPVSPKWEVDGGGTISDDGVFTVSEPGEWTVTATSWDGQYMAQATTFSAAWGDLTSAGVVPDTVNLQQGQVQQFTGYAYDADWRHYTVAPPMEPVPGGGWLERGTYVAWGEPGTYDLDPWGSSGLDGQVTVNIGGPPTWVSVEPNPAQVVEDGIKAFEAVGHDKDGLPTGVVDQTWSATGGTICGTDGVYFAGELPGEYSVSVASGWGPDALEGRAQVTVGDDMPWAIVSSGDTFSGTLDSEGVYPYHAEGDWHTGTLQPDASAWGTGDRLLGVVEIRYTDSGFVPQTAVVAVGDQIVWTNETDSDLILKGGLPRFVGHLPLLWRPAE